MIDLSILISSYNRLNLFKRTIFSIAANPPPCNFEVIIADDGSTEDILSELSKYSFKWKFIPVKKKEFEEKTGYRHFWNCPSLTFNVAFVVSQGRYIAQQGNECIAYKGVYDSLLKGLPQAKYAWCVSTTYDVPQAELDQLDEYGTNLSDEAVNRCSRWLLSNENNVPNYLSLFARDVWIDTGGLDERYIAGIGAEDCDLMRRAMSLPGFKWTRSNGVSLHQYHGGVNHFYRPLPSVISEARLAEGVAINRALYLSWDERTVMNQQPWPAGTYGFKHEDIISSNY